MFCSPCGSGTGSNYTSASTIECVTLCGAGISTNVTNSNLTVNISSLNGSTIGTVAIQNAAFDTFSRLITESPTTLFTAHAAFTENLQSLGYISTGSGTFTFDVSNAIVLMSTTGSAAGRAVRQTLEYQLYQPGKGHNAYFTWTPHYFGTFDTSIAVRAGVYDDYRDKNTPAGTTGAPPFFYASSIYGGTGQETNQPSMGHFFEVSGNEWFVVERQNSPNNVDQIVRVPQSNWNGDRLNPLYGNNPSGYQLDADADNLFWIERQWLGVGAVRLGLYYNGQRIVAHQFGHRDIRKPYTKLNKLPIRYEIEKVAGGSTDTAVMGSMCMASLIDGEYTPIGPIFSLPTPIINPTTRIGTTERPILLLRLQQQYCRATVKIKDIELFATNIGTFSVYKNPIITGPITWVNNPDKRSMVQYAIFANGTTEPTNTVSGGQCIQSGFFTQRFVQAGIQGVLDLLAAPPISSDVQGKPDVYCITMISAGGNIDINATCRWLEIT